MKILLALSFVFIFASCNKKPMDDPAKTVINPQAAIDQSPTAGEPPAGIVEENSMCICTKEYNPVCVNGQTFPSPCQAKCEGHTEYTEGACQ